MDKIIYSLCEEDINEIARQKMGRDLNNDEMRDAVKMLDSGLQWHEVASIAVDEIMVENWMKEVAKNYEGETE